MNEIVFKQIAFNELTGNFFLVDSNNNSYKCNLYGERVPSFTPYITGFSNRERNLLVRDSFSQLDNTLYRPQHKKFEGYSQFPRPISQPFFNEKFYPGQKRELLNTLRDSNRIKIDSNKHLLTLKSNQGLHYFTSTIAMQDDSSMKKFITLINQHIAKQRDKYTGLIDKNNKELRALNKLKSLMLSNAEDKILNRTINKTQGEFYQKFKTVSNFMKGETIKEKLPTLNVEVKPLNELEYKCLEEKRLFAGYKKPDNKIKGKSMSVVPDPNFRLKSAAEFYIQEKKMLYKVNPLALEHERYSNDFDRRILEKKRQQKLINDKIFGF